MARFGKQGSPPRLDSAPTSPMTKRSPTLPSATAPLAKGLVVGWALFMVLTVVGVVIALRQGSLVPILLDVVSR